MSFWISKASFTLELTCSEFYQVHNWILSRLSSRRRGTAPILSWQRANQERILSFFYNNNLEVKEEWTIVNSFHLTHHVHNSKQVSNFSHFPLFKFFLFHDSKYTANNSGHMVDVQTLKFKAIVLNRYFFTPLVREPKELVISSSDEFENVDLASDDMLFNIVMLILHSSAMTVTNSGGAQRRRQCPCYSL